MDILGILAGRRSVREYKPQPVPRRLLRQLVAAATLAPSAMNQQPWQFTIVTDRTLLDRISASAKSFMLEDLKDRPRPEHFQEMLGNPDFHIFYHAPALIVISVPANIGWAAEDCALAAENLMLAAHALGLGSCWIGFSQSWLNTPAGRDAIGLANGDLAVAPIAVGYPAAEALVVARNDPTIHWIV